MSEKLNLIEGADQKDLLFGGWLDDLVLAGAGNDLVFAGRGNDIIEAGAGNDLVFAGGGDDLVKTGEGRDYADGGRGIDTAQFDGDSSDYQITSFFGFTFITDLRTGETDTLRAFELLRFDDGLFNTDGDPINTDPTAVDDTAQVREDQPTTIDVLGNDTDPDNDPLTVIEATAENGTVDILPDGTLSYTSNLHYSGPDTISYTISDGKGGTSMASVSVLVGGVADTPALLVPDGLTTFDLAPIDLSGVLIGTRDTDGSESLKVRFSGLPEGAMIFDAVAARGEVQVLQTQLGGLGKEAGADGIIEFEQEELPEDLALQLPDGTTENFSLQVDVIATEAEPVLDDADRIAATSATIPVNVFESLAPQDDSVTTDEDTPLVLNLLGNDVGEQLQVVDIPQLGIGTVETDPGTGNLIYIPPENFSGIVSFDYLVGDAFGVTAAAAVEVTVRGVADAPSLAVPETLQSLDRAKIDFSPILASLTDTDGSESLIINLSGLPPGFGLENNDLGLTKLVDANGNVSLPDSTEGWFLVWLYPMTEDFTMTVEAVAVETDRADGAPETTASVQADIDVLVRESHAARNDSATTNEDESVVIDVLSNDLGDVPGVPTVSEITDPDNGSAVINPDGTVTYTPDPDFNGRDTFNYTIAGDGVREGSETVTVFVDVLPVNDAPEGQPVVSGTPQVGQPLTVDASPVDDPDGINNADLTYQWQSSPDGGATWSDIPGAVGAFFVPPQGLFGATVRVIVSYVDGDDTTEAVISDPTAPIAAANQDPVAADDTATTPEDTETVIDLLANDSDVDGNPLTITGLTDPTNGTLVDNGDGTVTYTPGLNFSGVDSFDYTIEDGAGGTDTATVQVTVEGVADLPVFSAPQALRTVDLADIDLGVITAELADTDRSEGLTIGLRGLPPGSRVVNNGLPRFIDVDDDGTVGIPGSLNGWVLQLPDGTTEDFDMIVEATATEADPVASPAQKTATQQAIVRIEVAESAEAQDDTASTNEDQAVTINVLANDLGDSGALVGVTEVTQGANGTVEIGLNGNVTYTPEADFFGTDTFTYTIDDADAGASTATVTVDVTPVNDPPVGRPEIAGTPEIGQTLTADVGSVDDADGLGPFSYQWQRSSDDGQNWVNIAGATAATFTPTIVELDQVLRVVVSYVDGGATQEQAESEPTIAPVAPDPSTVDQDPDAIDDTAETTQGQGISIDVLANDDAENGPLVITSVSEPSNGLAIFGPDIIGYAPLGDFTGTDTFTYTVQDANGDTDTATVTVTVTEDTSGGGNGGGGGGGNGGGGSSSNMLVLLTTAVVGPSGIDPSILPDGTFVFEEVSDTLTPPADTVRVGTQDADVFEFNSGDGNVLLLEFKQDPPNKDVIHANGFNATFDELDSNGDFAIGPGDAGVTVTADQLIIFFGAGDTLAVDGVSSLSDQDLLFV